MNRQAPRTLRVEGLSCRLGGNEILRDLTLPPLRGGGLVALLGPNGSGKSTLLRSIAGLAPAHAEVLSLDELNMRGLPARTRAETIRYLPQFLPDSIHLTVTEALLVALNARKALAPASAMARTEEVLNSLGIGRLGPRFLDELSGGQKQLVGLAQALADEPAVLLLDEPLASLDLNFQHHAMMLLKRLAADRGLLVLIVVHDLNIALRYADTALMLHRGRLLAAGEPLSVITPASIAQAFQVRARVEPCSLGYANVLVDDLIQL
jgi:iron complex transport system ATP-binding protein